MRLVMCLLLAATALTGCARRLTPTKITGASQPHYVQEQAWKGDIWFYPRERYEFEQTGLATVYPAHGHPAFTTDGEIYDPAALAAAHQTLQLPAVVRVINLENGRAILVRVNDRGPPSPHRVIALTPRAAALLQIPANGVAQVRIQADAVRSHALTEQLSGGAPKLALQAAPRTDVRQENLDGSPGARVAEADVAGLATTTPKLPDRLPEQVEQGVASPGRLWILSSAFARETYANHQLTALGPTAQILRIRQGRNQSFQVKAGPYMTVFEADSALDTALLMGLQDAHIVVE